MAKNEEEQQAKEHRKEEREQKKAQKEKEKIEKQQQKTQKGKPKKRKRVAVQAKWTEDFLTRRVKVEVEKARVEWMINVGCASIRLRQEAMGRKETSGLRATCAKLGTTSFARNRRL